MKKLSQEYQIMQDDWVKELTEKLKEIYGHVTYNGYSVTSDGNHIFIGKGNKTPYVKLTINYQVSTARNILSKRNLIPIPKKTLKEKYSSNV